MSYVGAGGAGAGYAAIAQAIKAFGAIVHVEPNDFLTILSKTDDPLVIVAEGGFLKKNFQYLTPYKGMVFFTKSVTPLLLPGGTEIVAAKSILVPMM